MWNKLSREDMERFKRGMSRPPFRDAGPTRERAEGAQRGADRNGCYGAGPLSSLFASSS
jgi:hypothetical protein